MVRKHKPPRLPTPELILQRAAEETEERIESSPPAVRVVKIERENLLNPASGHGVTVHFTTSYRLRDFEIRKIIIRGAKCVRSD